MKMRECLLFSLGLLALPLPAEERYLLAAENQVIEVNRAGRVTARSRFS